MRPEVLKHDKGGLSVTLYGQAYTSRERINCSASLERGLMVHSNGAG